MIKTGPAFSDYLISDKARRKRRFGQILNYNFVFSAPYIIFIVIFSILFLRLFYLQILRGNYYRRLSDENRVRSSVIYTTRGIIMDRKGRELVNNLPAFRVNDHDEWIEKDEALKLISEGEKVDSVIQRKYLYKDVFAHVVGYVGQISKEEVILPKFKEYGISDFVGKMGLEKQYEEILHGVNGKEIYEVDAKGKKIRLLGKEEGNAGTNLYTTLDLDIQLSAYRAFEDVKKGAAIVSDPRNGAILALYSKPTFDANLFTQTETYRAEGVYKTREETIKDVHNQPFLNRAIGGTYPPGSTYKLITAVAALESGAISKDTKFEDTGILKVGDFSYGNWYFLQYGKTEGEINVVSAVKRSNDIFFYKAAEQTGVKNLENWSRKFGLGEKLDIDLPEEEKGTVPNPSWKKETIKESWYLGDTFLLGIGQGYLLTTPLQVNMWTVPFANGGTLLHPHVVQGKARVIRKNFIKKRNIDLVREGMKESCEEGGVGWPFFNFRIRNSFDSAQDKHESGIKVDGRDFTESQASDGAKMVRITVGCKTGTAETYKEEDPHAWITVFAPFYNPEIVVTVLVENGGEGSSVAAPIAKKILEEYFERK